MTDPGRESSSDLPEPEESSAASSRREVRQRREARKRPALKERSPMAAFLVECAIIVVLAVVISFVVKTFFMRAFYIPSESMEETLAVDDRIAVNLLAPQLMDVERGDVVVFEDTRQWWGGGQEPETNAVQDALTFIGLMPDTSSHFVVKRVIGVGGDTVECCTDDGLIQVNGEPIEEPYIYEGNSPSDMDFSVEVPEDHVWLLGDHRAASADSRFHVEEADMGAVAEDDIIGRSVAIIWPWDRWGGGGSDREPFAEVPDSPPEGSER